MHCIRNIRPGAFLQEVYLPKNGPIIETRIKRQNFGRQGRRLLGRRVPRDVNIDDDTVNYLWLCHRNIPVVLLLYVDFKLILYLFFV